MLMDNVGKLITPMPLTEEVMRTQFCDKVDEYGTLEYTKNSYRLEEYKDKYKAHHKIFFDFETITSEENICLTYVGFTTMIYSTSLSILVVPLLIC